MPFFPGASRSGFLIAALILSAHPAWGRAEPSPPADRYRTLDCMGRLDAVDQALAASLPDRDAIELRLLKARLLRDDRTRKNARTEGMAAIEAGIAMAVEAERRYPNVPWPWALEGMLDLVKTQYQGFPKGMSTASRASVANKMALKLGPDDPEANLSKGIEDYYKPWFVGGSYVKALKRFRKALEEDPSNPRIMSWTGLAYLALDRDRRGFALLKKAADLCPGNPIYARRLKTRRPR
jgi:tetratricopeptide (TPR) repeat protein